MVYRAIGLMSGSSLDGLDIVCAAYHENGGKWTCDILAAGCLPYSDDWIVRLTRATSLNALDYQLLHVDYGHYLGQQVNQFIRTNHLDFQVALVSSHGHTSFHMPSKKMTAQLGDGASIAAETGLPVVSDLRAMDIALGGQGAPIVPIGEKLLFGGHQFYLNLGGIANLSIASAGAAFDVCPANRVLNLLAGEAGKDFDDQGFMAASGAVDMQLLDQLNALEYYSQPFPKSLDNQFGTDTIYPIIKARSLSVYDSLSTYVEHICAQITGALRKQLGAPGKAVAAGEVALAKATTAGAATMLVTGGGAFNTFLVDRLTATLAPMNITPVVPESEIVNFKEALIMGLIGILRWREEANVLSSVTGASRSSVGGAFWMGQEG